jgi:cysteine sulfinate desulfinase/cysteine desulfurase-like protein
MRLRHLPQLNTRLGLAAELSSSDHAERLTTCERHRAMVMAAFEPFRPSINGDPGRSLPSTVNLCLPGLDSEAVMLALKGVVAISSGSACTSQKYEPSPVLSAMRLDEVIVRGALRLSWTHLYGSLRCNRRLRCLWHSVTQSRPESRARPRLAESEVSPSVIESRPGQLPSWERKFVSLLSPPKSPVESSCRR